MESANNVVQQHVNHPGRTLGRSGYVPTVRDQLSDRITELDALTTVLAAASDDGSGLELNKFNAEIQLAALSLAARLAHEVNELHEQLFIEEVNSRVAAQ